MPTASAHFSQCPDCGAWREKTVVALGHIVTTLSAAEQNRLLSTVLRRIALLSAQKPAKPLWRDWALPLAFPSAVFGFAAAVLFQNYFSSVARFSSFYFVSATRDLRFAFGIGAMWILAFSAAIWVTFALIRRQLSTGTLRNPHNEI